MQLAALITARYNTLPAGLCTVRLVTAVITNGNVYIAA